MLDLSEVKLLASIDYACMHFYMLNRQSTHGIVSDNVDFDGNVIIIIIYVLVIMINTNTIIGVISTTITIRIFKIIINHSGGDMFPVATGIIIFDSLSS